MMSQIVEGTPSVFLDRARRHSVCCPLLVANLQKGGGIAMAVEDTVSVSPFTTPPTGLPEAKRARSALTVVTTGTTTAGTT